METTTLFRDVKFPDGKPLLPIDTMAPKRSPPIPGNVVKCPPILSISVEDASEKSVPMNCPLPILVPQQVTESYAPVEVSKKTTDAALFWTKNAPIAERRNFFMLILVVFIGKFCGNWYPIRTNVNAMPARLQAFQSDFKLSRAKRTHHIIRAWYQHLVLFVGLSIEL